MPTQRLSGWVIRVGAWSANALVVDVTLFTTETWFDRAGNFHSDELHVVERYARTSPDQMHMTGDDREPQGVHPAVEDAHAPLSPQGDAHPDPRVRVLRLCSRRFEVEAGLWTRLPA